MEVIGMDCLDDDFYSIIKDKGYYVSGRGFTKTVEEELDIIKCITKITLSTEAPQEKINNILKLFHNSFHL